MMTPKRMMTAKEMVEIMLAYERGEQIEISDKTGKWYESREPLWNWEEYNYRVKPKTRYVPFETAEEFLKAQRLHGNSVYISGKRYTLRASVDCSDHVIITKDDNKGGYYEGSFGQLFYYGWKFADGTPCGKEVIYE